MPRSQANVAWNAYVATRLCSQIHGTRFFASSYTRKPSTNVYITYVVQFHDVSLQFSRRIFHHYSGVFLLFLLFPRPLYHPLPPLLVLSPLFTSVFPLVPSISFGVKLCQLQGRRTTLCTKTNWKYLAAKYSRGTGFDSPEYMGRQRYIRSYRLVIKYPPSSCTDTPGTRRSCTPTSPPNRLPNGSW